MLATLPMLLLAQTALASQTVVITDAGAASAVATPVAAAAPAADEEPQAQSGGSRVFRRHRRHRAAAAKSACRKCRSRMSVIGGAELEKTGAFNVNRLQQQQPSLQFYSSNPRNSAINIRGLGAPFGLTNDGIEQGVGFYVDGVYIGRVGASTFDFVDVERVEVLRGPQGTLYGKNTTSGALNITHARAELLARSHGSKVSGGNYEFVQAKASASGPSSDNLALRLSALGHDAAAARSTTSPATNICTASATWACAASCCGSATDTIDLTLSGDFNVQSPDCCVQYYARVGATQRPTRTPV